ncbi:hypothetical protein ACFRMQ_32110 [Kitasatospora sp. NPDC056783]|uniref:hypothetical protein n=1 Tax=Kitasatospora sp. NPDC056783 TaxID=3345943 RepID=UPI00369D3BAD
MTSRRAILLPATALLLAVTGCSSDGASPVPTSTAAVGAPADASGAFDPAAAIAHGFREPYVTAFEMVVETGEGPEKEVFTTTGRTNHNTSEEGSRSETKTVRGSEVVMWEEQVTADGVRHRRDKTEDRPRWTTDPKALVAPRNDADITAGFVKVLLDAGPAARKGMETEAGVPVYHLAARLSPAEMRRADPCYGNGGQQNAGTEGVDCELWIDRLGRMVRAEHSTVVAGQRVVTKEHYSDFGPVETFTPPTTG